MISMDRKRGRSLSTLLRMMMLWGSYSTSLAASIWVVEARGLLLRAKCHLEENNQVYKASSLSRPAYQPLNVKFFIDNGYKNYWVIWKWLNLFNDAKTSKSEVHMEYMNNNKNAKLENPMQELVSTFSIFALDEYNNKIVQFKYKHVFPVSLSEINFSHQDPSEISCTASFAFNQMNVELLKNNQLFTNTIIKDTSLDFSGINLNVVNPIAKISDYHKQFGANWGVKINRLISDIHLIEVAFNSQEKKLQNEEKDKKDGGGVRGKY